jgi:hypothetical protein
MPPDSTMTNTSTPHAVRAAVDPARIEQRPRRPQHRGKDREREAQMRGQAELRHSRIVDEPAFHHEPADGALQSTEQEDAGERPREAARNASTREEPQVRHEEHDADRAPEQPMEILPPEDALELRERHRVIDVAEFGRRLVLGERVVPVGRVERRQRADDRLPLGDRQAGMREPRHAAHDDHREHQQRAHEKPRDERSRGHDRRLGVRNANGDGGRRPGEVHPEILP